MKAIIFSTVFTFLAISRAFAPTRKILPSAIRCAPLHMGLLSRFRKKKEIKVDPIEIGSTLPEIDIQTLSDGEIVAVPIREALGDGTAILVGMPGAFTTVCTKTHLPGYIENANKLFDLGVNKIAAITTNDKFVNRAWAKEVGLEDLDEESKITILSDGDGELVKALGMVEDMGFGVGVRSKRFALIAQDGVVSRLETDEGMEECENTTAATMVEILTPPKVEEENVLALNGTGAIYLAVVALALLGLFSHGDGGSTAESIAPTIKKEAADFAMLQNYR